MGETMDKLTELCNTTENYEKDLCKKNRIVCVRKCLSEYISGDRDKFLWLKAQVENHRKFNGTIMTTLSVLITGISFICSLISMAFSYVPKENISDEMIMIVYSSITIFLFILLIVLIVMQISNKKNSNTDKLIEYVAVVLEDMDKK